MKILTTILLLVCAVISWAQPRNIETFTNTTPGGMVPRQMQYTADGEGFLCVNGANRFTRALYGSNTDFRVETSDRPIFALYKSKNYRSVRFYVNGIQLDEAEYCEARYEKGRRSYLVRDKRWGREAVLRVECVAKHDAEGCYWSFDAKGFSSKKITLTYKLCQIANPKLRRNGDIGADKAGCFEPSPTDEGLVMASMTFKKNAFAVAVPHDDKAVGYTVALTTKAPGYDAARQYFEALSERVRFITPDPMLNTLGATLSLAADGAWDGETWLHGAIGWRMPLAGWRAGYLGDVMGWNDRAVRHFDAYARSQVTDVPATISSPSQDSKLNMARAEKRWGTQMYSNGYICRNPNRNDQMHHYDMNLNYIDELLWHFEYDADTAYMRKMWPVIKSHLAWEKRNFDKDGNHLYDAYCCIWASDALYYNGGEVTHSTAYNYRGNLLAAKIARIIGEDAEPYQQEAEAILKAMNERLWTEDHWAEYRDGMGLKRLHPDAALWSIYTPIDCGVGTPAQMYSCTKYVDEHIPHIRVEGALQDAYVLSTSDWMPYSWSINNVASAEIMNTGLAFFKAGRAAEGMNIVRGNVMDQMYLGQSPGNLGQISYYDAARGESYRDFGDNIGISARAIVQGVFGVVPNALDGRCVIRPGFPLEWDSVEVQLPYLSYKYKRHGNKATLAIEQHFSSPLRMIVRINGRAGDYTDYAGSNDAKQVITVMLPEEKDADVYAAGDTKDSFDMSCNSVQPFTTAQQIAIPFNANVTDIFRNEYLSPRPQSTSLEIPTQGIGEWCHPEFTVDINDSVFRAKAVGNVFEADGVRYSTPQEGKNILFASLWDNYPDSVTIPLCEPLSGNQLAIMLTGSTNHMQFKMENAMITVRYVDGTTSSLALVPPYNYCPIEQDYYVDGKAFRQPAPAPWRVSLGTGVVSRELGKDLGVPSTEVYGRELKGGAAQLLYAPLQKGKKVKEVTLRCLSNDIVVGVMAMTLLDIE